MIAMKSEGSKNIIPTPYRKNVSYQVGDRVITSNSRLGTIIRLDKDDLGEYFVVRLDILPGEFAYDAWDLEKVSS